METLQTWMKRLIFALFIALYAWIGLRVLHNNRAGLNTMLLAVLATSAVVLLYHIYAHNTLLRELSEAQGRYLLLAFMLIVAAIQVAVGLQLRFIPAWDIDAIFGGGRDWAVTGNFERYREYHAIFANNWGGLFLFRIVFTVFHFLGGTDFYAAALVFNTFLLQLVVWAVYDSAERLAGTRAAVMALILLGIYLPFYTMGAAFYTDALSMPFVLLTINFYLRGLQAEHFTNRLCMFLLCGAFAAIGTLIKGTVIITFIAIIIDWALRHRKRTWSDLRQTFIPLGASLCILALIITGFNSYMTRQVGGDLIQERRMPVSHWIMMGLYGDGRYHPAEYEFSMGLPDLDARRQEIPPIIWERVRERGFAGMIRHFGTKLAINFESGTFNQRDFFWLEPQNETDLHDIVLNNRQHYDTYNHIATALLLAYIGLALLGAARALRKPEFCVPWLSLIGLALFLMIWEVNNRLPMNYFPVIVLAAVLGLAGDSFDYQGKYMEE